MSPSPSPNRLLRTLLGVVLGVLIGGSLGGAYLLHHLWQQLPPVDHLADYDPRLPLRIYARDGTLLAEYGQERRELVSLDGIPLVLRQALLAIEDANFYGHGAVDFSGMARAVLSNFRAGESAQGGSTITMQVARVFFLSREKTYSRKLTEVLLAYKLESVYSKDKLLELYMNQVYLGERAYGFAAAASVYFDKTLNQLTVAEAAMLAGLPKAPSAYNPVANRARATVRQRHILHRMHALGHLDTQQLQDALAETLTLRVNTSGLHTDAAFAVEQARQMVVDRFGDEAYALGLNVSTTIDVAAQRAATRELRAGLQAAQARRGDGGRKHRVPLPRMEGALVSMDVNTGEILALTGGFDFALNQFDHAVQAQRQPGSTFKPFVYSAALEKGYFPGTLVDDTQRVVTPAARGRKAWSPRNYGNQYEGFIDARRGLVRSKNLVAVNLMEAAGTDHVSAFAARFGFAPERNPAGLPLALGAGTTTPLQLTQAYTVFANGGHWVQPRLIRQVRERGGDVLYAAPDAAERSAVISPRNAYVMNSLLRDVVRQGTGRRAAALGRPDVAGKTGTSNDARDAWFAGYAGGVASVVWMGFDQPRSLGSRATGGTLALPVWTAYMRVAVADRPVSQPAMPEGLVRFGEDDVYAEYLAGNACVDNRSPFVRPAFACATAFTDGGAAPLTAMPSP
ncbi:PBP1A family penicillin-binding protein [Hydrogenophaga sp. 2FB]|uniref:penicillin-binding protein 1A n=1 Tax=Hydrogenophaga sp. 2FB TaxID=2502187 RepID=UPI00207BC3F4|nr:PBP1A family penicillin-binding protein [Hydrogenophaga sp. 2FB]